GQPDAQDVRRGRGGLRPRHLHPGRGRCRRVRLQRHLLDALGRLPGRSGALPETGGGLGGEEPSYHAAEAYMALIVAADALNRAASLAPDAVREALKATNLMTAAGPVTFADYDGVMNQNPLDLEVEQVQDGRFVTVNPFEIAAGAARFPTPAWDQR